MCPNGMGWNRQAPISSEEIMKNIIQFYSRLDRGEGHDGWSPKKPSKMAGLTIKNDGLIMV